MSDLTERVPKSRTEEIFVSQKTGKRYRLAENDLTREHGEFLKPITFIIPIIEPTLEVGDWIQFSHCKDPYHIEEPLSLHLDKLREIRKANGEVWVKEDGEWRKK